MSEFVRITMTNLHNRDGFPVCDEQCPPSSNIDMCTNWVLQHCSRICRSNGQVCVPYELEKVKKSLQKEHNYELIKRFAMIDKDMEKERNTLIACGFKTFNRAF